MKDLPKHLLQLIDFPDLGGPRHFRFLYLFIAVVKIIIKHAHDQPSLSRWSSVFTYHLLSSESFGHILLKFKYLYSAEFVISTPIS